MKKPLLIAALLIMSASSSYAQTLGSAREFVERGANAYLKEGASAAIASWLKGSALEGNTQATSQANSLRQVEDFYGKPESFEVVSEREISARSKLLLVVINYQKGPLYARMQAFKLMSGAWVLTEFQFKTESAAIFPNYLLYEGR